MTGCQEKSAARPDAAVHRERGGQEQAAVTQGVGAIVVRPAPGSVYESPQQSARGHVMVPRMGVQLRGSLPFEAWLGIGSQLSAMASSAAWCLGDWLVYGQQAYAGRYRQAAEQTGLDYQTLRNYAWVTRRFALLRRRETLTFGHHAEVASLPEPEQDFWLRKAEELGWSTSRLRQQVRASLQERDSDRAVEAASKAQADETGPSEPANSQVSVRIPLTAEQMQLCEQAAGKQGLTVPAWSAHVLDRAARDSLDHSNGPKGDY